ncbi:metallophosphoesterase [Rhizobium ruizarguesonis]|uniref:metallophosphoesterase n=1 Tax=Rhizobium ruizarguesonis TaxID=2081791 RepID=UPI0013EE782D
MAHYSTTFAKSHRRRPNHTGVFFLGDIIDRGPQSFEAMELVIQTLDELPGSKLLRGNHEDFVLRFLDIAFTRHYDLMNWMWNGGAETALSYGVTPQRTGTNSMTPFQRCVRRWTSRPYRNHAKCRTHDHRARPRIRSCGSSPGSESGTAVAGRPDDDSPRITGFAV